MPLAPKISVIVPVYNVEKSIGRCLVSILNSTFQDFEIIIVNDAATDSSMSIAVEYAKNDNRVRIINKSINEGLMAARRSGINQASGMYITFCDSDDYLPVNGLEVLYNNAIQGNADIVIGDLTSTLATGKQEVILSRLPFGFESEAVIKAILIGACSQSLCNKMFLRDLLCRPEIETIQDFTNGEDGVLLFQVLPHAKKIVQVNESVYNYIHNNQSLTQLKLTSERSYKLLFGMNFLCSTIRKYYNNEFDIEINQYVLKSLRSYGIGGGDFKLLERKFPLLNKEISFRRSIRSFRSLSGLHYFLLSASTIYRTLYRIFYNLYGRVNILISSRA